jgi:hypothetical protein
LAFVRLTLVIGRIPLAAARIRIIRRLISPIALRAGCGVGILFSRGVLFVSGVLVVIGTPFVIGTLSISAVTLGFFGVGPIRLTGRILLFGIVIARLLWVLFFLGWLIALLLIFLIPLFGLLLPLPLHQLLKNFLSVGVVFRIKFFPILLIAFGRLIGL